MPLFHYIFIVHSVCTPFVLRLRVTEIWRHKIFLFIYIIVHSKTEENNVKLVITSGTMALSVFFIRIHHKYPFFPQEEFILCSLIQSSSKPKLSCNTGFLSCTNHYCLYEHEIRHSTELSASFSQSLQLSDLNILFSCRADRPFQHKALIDLLCISFPAPNSKQSKWWVYVKGKQEFFWAMVQIHKLTTFCKHTQLFVFVCCYLWDMRVMPVL